MWIVQSGHQLTRSSTYDQQTFQLLQQTRTTTTVLSVSLDTTGTCTSGMTDNPSKKESSFLLFFWSGPKKKSNEWGATSEAHSLPHGLIPKGTTNVTAHQQTQPIFLSFCTRRGNKAQKKKFTGVAGSESRRRWKKGKTYATSKGSCVRALNAQSSLLLDGREGGKKHLKTSSQTPLGV